MTTPHPSPSSSPPPCRRRRAFVIGNRTAPMTLCLGLVLLVLVLHQPRVLAAPSPPSCLCLVSWTPGLAVDPNNFAEAQRVDNYSGNFIPRNVTATLCGASSFPTNSQQCEPCNCDQACVSLGDCCPDYDPVCTQTSPPALSLRPVVLETMANLALSLPLPTVQFQVFGAAVPFSLWPPQLSISDTEMVVFSIDQWTTPSQMTSLFHSQRYVIVGCIVVVDVGMNIFAPETIALELQSFGAVAVIFQVASNLPDLLGAVFTYNSSIAAAVTVPVIYVSTTYPLVQEKSSSWNNSTRMRLAESCPSSCLLQSRYPLGFQPTSIFGQFVDFATQSFENMFLDPRGDSFCNAECNNEACGYDWGDCCIKTCVGPACTDNHCRDPRFNIAGFDSQVVHQNSTSQWASWVEFNFANYSAVSTVTSPIMFAYASAEIANLASSYGFSGEAILGPPDIWSPGLSGHAWCPPANVTSELIWAVDVAVHPTSIIILTNGGIPNVVSIADYTTDRGWRDLWNATMQQTAYGAGLIMIDFDLQDRNATTRSSLFKIVIDGTTINSFHSTPELALSTACIDAMSVLSSSRACESMSSRVCAYPTSTQFINACAAQDSGYSIYSDCESDEICLPSAEAVSNVQICQATTMETFGFNITLNYDMFTNQLPLTNVTNALTFSLLHNDLFQLANQISPQCGVAFQNYTCLILYPICNAPTLCFEKADSLIRAACGATFAAEVYIDSLPLCIVENEPEPTPTVTATPTPDNEDHEFDEIKLTAMIVSPVAFVALVGLLAFCGAPFVKKRAQSRQIAAQSAYTQIGQQFAIEMQPTSYSESLYSAKLKELEGQIGAQVYSMLDSSGMSAIHYAARTADISTIQMIANRGLSVDQPDAILHDTALVHACRSGQLKSVLVLLRNNADANVINLLGETPLHVAAGVGKPDIVLSLLARGARVDVQTRTGSTPVHAAVSSGNADVVRALLDNIANVNVADQDGTTPLHIAARLDSAEGSAILELLMMHQPNYGATDAFSFTPLHWAACLGHTKQVEMLIDTGLVDINAPNNKGETPLFLASREGHASVVQFLIKSGADNSVIEGDGRSLAQFADESSVRSVSAAASKRPTDNRILESAESKQGRLKDLYADLMHIISTGALPGQSNDNVQQSFSPYFIACKQVIDMWGYHGAMMTDKHGNCLIHYAAARGDAHTLSYLLAMSLEQEFAAIDSTDPCTPLTMLEDSQGNTCLHLASSAGSLDCVALLLRANSDINRVNNEAQTALMLAAAEGHTQVCVQLVNAGAELNIHDASGSTALIYAAGSGKAELVDFLLLHLANVDLRDSTGSTALVVAISHGHVDIAKSLIAARSNLNLRDVKGYTALHWATIMNNQELVMLIMQKGADPNISSHGGVSPLAFAMQANNIEMQNVIYALAKSLNIVLEEPFVMPDDSSDEIKLSIVTVPPVKTRTGSAKKSNVSPGSLMSKRKPSVKQQQAGKAPPAVSSSSSSSREHRPPTPDSTDSSSAQSFAETPSPYSDQVREEFVGSSSSAAAQEGSSVVPNGFDVTPPEDLLYFAMIEPAEGILFPTYY